MPEFDYDAPLALSEMARIRSEEFSPGTLFYHGTDDDSKGLAILKSGLIQPGTVAKTRVRKAFEPLAGRSYVSQQLRASVIYALGGDVLGDDTYGPDEKSRYGWLFVVDPAEDVVVDEDDLGEIAHDLLNDRADHDATRRLSDINRSVMLHAIDTFLSPQQRLRCKNYDDYAHLTVAGKKLATSLDRYWPDRLKDLAIQALPRLAFKGPLKIVQAWRIDKFLTGDLLSDGSNFFDIAEEVPVPQPPIAHA